MALLIYVLCAATALGCSISLLLAYRRTHANLLLWSGLCFALLGANSALLVVDRLWLPDIDLFTLRNATALLGICMLLYGLIWETK